MGQQRMSWLDGITDSRDMSLSQLQERVKRKPGMLQSLGSQRVEHDRETEQQQRCSLLGSGGLGRPREDVGLWPLLCE